LDNRRTILLIKKIIQIFTIIVFSLSCKNVVQDVKVIENKPMNVVEDDNNLNGDDKQIESPLDMNLQEPFPLTISHPLQLHTKKNKKYSKEFIEAQNILDEALEFCEVSQDYWQKGELDSAIESLDQAYALMLRINDSSNILLQQKDDLRYLISKRLMEIYASRYTVVNGTHEAIPVVINKHVQEEINILTGRDRKFFISSYKRSGRYRHYIVEELKKAGLPASLSWLPLIESGFKIRALSKSRALGLWQFIPSTGYKFGLKRNRYIDERMDPEKSTMAAIAYLTALHKIFGDWITVLAAYNCGEGRVLRIIQKQNVNYLDNFWDLYDRLPNETARYVPKFLATLHIIENMQKYGFNPDDLYEPVKYESIEISRQIHLNNIASKTGIPYKILKAYNPELRYGVTPQEPYMLKIPENKKNLLLACINSIPSFKPKYSRNTKGYHIVKSGESLYSIAKRYNVKISDLKAANRMRGSRIIAGKKLRIPGKRYYSKKSNKVKNVRKYAKTSSIKKHIVRKGDSLWNIARRYQTTTHQIKKINNIMSSALYIGQTLNIPLDNNNVARNRNIYKVKSGDSPFQIALKHNMELADFLRINHLGPGSKIYPGQLLLTE